MAKKVDIICPFYNGEEYIVNINNYILKQKDIEINKILYILTESEDNSKEILINNHIPFVEISKNDFSHSLTREKALFDSTADYVIMITQDVRIEDEYCFSKLLNYTIENNVAVSYARQIGYIHGIDRYFRKISYGKNSYVYSKEDLQKKGQNACFLSDVCACYNVETFKKINGYDGKNLNTNEDMYYAYKCLKNDLKVGYCADAVVYHTHKLTFKNTYERYKEIGHFFYHNPEIDALPNNRMKYFKCMGIMFIHFAWKSFILFPIHALIRHFGIVNGKKEEEKNDNKK